MHWSKYWSSGQTAESPEGCGASIEGGSNVVEKSVKQPVEKAFSLGSDAQK